MKIINLSHKSQPLPCRQCGLYRVIGWNPRISYTTNYSASNQMQWPFVGFGLSFHSYKVPSSIIAKNTRKGKQKRGKGKKRVVPFVGFSQSSHLRFRGHFERVQPTPHTHILVGMALLELIDGSHFMIWAFFSKPTWEEESLSMHSNKRNQISLTNMVKGKPMCVHVACAHMLLIVAIQINCYWTFWGPNAYQPKKYSKNSDITEAKNINKLL